jgi:hypothetical protein
MEVEIEIFKKASGNLRAIALMYMDVTQGKKTVQKRICHAYLFEGNEQPAITLDRPPSNMTMAQLTEYTRKVGLFARELQCLYDTPRGTMTYYMVTEKYLEILSQNPGKALWLNDDTVAVLHEGRVCTGLIENGVVNELCELSPHAWEQYAGHWSSDESAEETMATVEQPILDDYQLNLTE